MPASDQPRETYRHGALKDDLLRFGVELARNGGPEAVVLREATRLAGVTPHAAYRHFEDKGALLAAVSDGAFSMLADRIESELGGLGHPEDGIQSARARLRAVGVGYVGFAWEEPNLFRTAFSVPVDMSTATSPSKAGALGHTPYELLRDAIDGCVRAGIVDDGERAGAEMFAWSTVHGLATLVVSGPLRHLSAEAVTSFTAALLDRVDRAL